MNNLSVLTSPFMIHALLAGVMVAICAGMLGYFVIMRRMTFASHALAHIGIPGATGAILLGLPAGLGLTVFCIGGALGISRMGRKPTEREIATGTALSLASAFGLYFSHQTSKASKEMQSVLFGNLLSVSTASLIQFAIFTLIIFITLMIIYRPLLFTSVDYEVAQTRGINYSLLNTIFVVLLGLTVVMSVQVVGALLLFALTITPTATAIKMFASPKAIIITSCIISTFCVVCGLIMSVIFNLPPSFPIVLITFVFWIVSQFVFKRK